MRLLVSLHSLYFAQPLSLSTSLSFYIYLRLSLPLPLSLSPSLSFYISLSLSTSLSLALSLTLSLYIYISLTLSLFLHISLSLSTYLSLARSLSLTHSLSLTLLSFSPPISLPFFHLIFAMQHRQMRLRLCIAFFKLLRLIFFPFRFLSRKIAILFGIVTLQLSLMMYTLINISLRIFVHSQADEHRGRAVL